MNPMEINNLILEWFSCDIMEKYVAMVVVTLILFLLQQILAFKLEEPSLFGLYREDIPMPVYIWFWVTNAVLVMFLAPIMLLSYLFLIFCSLGGWLQGYIASKFIDSMDVLTEDNTCILRFGDD